MTKVYKYGLLPPTAGAELVRAQMDLAWRSAVARLRAYADYREQKAAIEREKAPACRALADVQETISACRTELRSLKTSRDAQMTEAARLLRVQLRDSQQRAKTLRPVAREERLLLRESGAFAALEAELKATYLRLARAFADAGLFWGQRQLVEAAHDQRTKARELTMPRDWGSVGIQLQHGLDAAEVGHDPRLTITRDVTPIPGRHGKPRPRLKLRIGPDNGVAEWPIILHRPLPDGASIRFCKVTVRTIGRRERWEAHLTLNLPDPVPVENGGPWLAVRPTFTDVDGSLVVAEWADDAGGSGAYVLPLSPEVKHIAGALAKADDLRQIRDKRRDALLERFAAWKADGKPLPSCWPSSLARWESCNRIAEFILRTWARERGDGDEALFVEALAWAKQDRHLFDWEAHTRSKAVGRRLHLYRVWSYHMAQASGGLIVPATDYAETAKRRAEPEREHTLSAKGSRQRVLASPGLLRQCLVQAFLSAGKPAVALERAESPEQMLRERSSGQPITLTAREPKFAKRHAKAGGRADAAESEAEGGDE